MLDLYSAILIVGGGMAKSKWQEIRKARVGDDPGAEARIRATRRLLEFAVRLAQLRERRGVTQTDLAEWLDVSQANVSRIEREDDVYLSTLDRYVRALGGTLEIHAVFDDEDIKLTPA